MFSPSPNQARVNSSYYKYPADIEHSINYCYNYLQYENSNPLVNLNDSPDIRKNFSSENFNKKSKKVIDILSIPLNNIEKQGIKVLNKK
jgi:hypothetical protein